jgi:hypothetical protein
MAELSWTRERLDRQAVERDGRIVFVACGTHAGQHVVAIYQDGDLRLLCPICGFETRRIKVAFAENELRRVQEAARQRDDLLAAIDKHKGQGIGARRGNETAADRALYRAAQQIRAEGEER